MKNRVFRRRRNVLTVWARFLRSKRNIYICGTVWAQGAGLKATAANQTNGSALEETPEEKQTHLIT